MKVRKGDLVEYCYSYSIKEPITIEKATLMRLADGKRPEIHSGIGIVDGTEEDWFMIKGHVSIKRHIVPRHAIKRVITKALVPLECFKDF